MKNPQLDTQGRLQHLLTTEGLPKAVMEQILDTAASFVGVTERDVKKVPLLRGKSVFNLFFENSTRTRTSVLRHSVHTPYKIMIPIAAPIPIQTFRFQPLAASHTFCPRSWRIRPAPTRFSSGTGGDPSPPGSTAGLEVKILRRTRGLFSSTRVTLSRSFFLAVPTSPPAGGGAFSSAMVSALPDNFPAPEGPASASATPPTPAGTPAGPHDPSRVHKKDVLPGLPGGRTRLHLQQV